MNGSLMKVSRLLLPLGSLVFCTSLMAMPTPGKKDPQTPPDNTKQGPDQPNRGPTEDESGGPRPDAEDSKGDP